MNNITKLGILLGMLWVGCIGTFARTKGAASAIYYSEPYQIYTPYYSADRVSSVVQIPISTPKIKKEKSSPITTPAVNESREKHMMLGINVAPGFSMDYYEGGWHSYYKMTFGVDFAYPITRKFGIGAYLSAGFTTDNLHHAVDVGVLTTIGNYHDKKAAFLFGVGYDNSYYYHSADIRLGVICRNGFYTMLELAAGDAYMAMTFNIGYNFGALYPVR